MICVLYFLFDIRYSFNIKSDMILLQESIYVKPQWYKVQHNSLLYVHNRQGASTYFD